MENEENKGVNYLEVIAKLINVIIILLLVIVVLIILLYTGFPNSKKEAKESLELKSKKEEKLSVETKFWLAPDTSLIANEKEAAQIRYGRQLIANTAFYLGPKGKVKSMSNGMNCQNCHLEAGTKIFGNNYSAVASTYPKFRERSGSIESIQKRVNDCFERSLNGEKLDSSGKEMKAIVAYIKWLGKDVEKGKKPEGSGLRELPYLSRAADPEKGKQLYAIKCTSCHMEDGNGKMEEDGITYKYPPLWGKNSFNIGAGLYRLSRFAAYIKCNMPQGSGFENPQLSDDEAWDIAAFVDSQPRPDKDLSKDWPIIAGKPVDHPFGPYADSFSQKQHKFGPFEPIADAKKVKKNK